MKILVLTAFYPIPNMTHERMFVHMRNQYYKKCGIDVTVLNFNAQNEYEIDGIHVITLKMFEKNHDKEKYDIVISHSANLRNHYKFLKRYERVFRKLVFFFHGHEMLYLNKDYPTPYSFLPASKWYRQILQNAYDVLKIKLWASYYKKLAFKSDFVFVSEWLHKRVLMNANICDDDLQNRVHIINNSIGSIFEIMDYDAEADKLYDFVTIRSNLDGSKYCVDLVTKYAEQNPSLSFLLIGKGFYFDHYDLPENIEWINKTLNHDELITYINKSKCALMLTREDTQGVMTCEMESFGIPVITSDIEVCHEFFEDNKNIKMIPNLPITEDIHKISKVLCSGIPFEKDNRFFSINTIQKEVDMFHHLVERKL